MKVDAIIERVLQAAVPAVEDLTALLALRSSDELNELRRAAYRIKRAHVGTTVYFRGIVEFSNQCAKNCYYCGIRRDNRNVERFSMSLEEILKAARWAHEAGYGSIVLQAGERSDATFVGWVTQLLRSIHESTNGELGVTLSLGEQSRETYKQWHDAGAHRYLLRIETTCRKLYGRLHPAGHDFDRRLQCLHDLREVGYQVGTGVMIGLPGQTTHDLAEDVLFFKKMDVDMIGMGPYVLHGQTPLGRRGQSWSEEERLNLALKMVSVCRLVMPDVNIAATTALQALHPSGRELGLQAGANIVMPNITDVRYREAYQLYENKPCVDENHTACRGCLERRIKGIGETIGFNKHGDAPHYRLRQEVHA